MKQNKIVNVGFFGGLAGLFNSPRKKLEKIIKKENDKGYCVRQVLPGNPNPLFLILSFIILVLTFFIYQPLPGYIIIFEKEVSITVV